MKRLIGLLITLAALAAVFITQAVSGSSTPVEDEGVPPDDRPPRADREPAPTQVSLRSFETCDDLLAYARQHAMPMVSPWGLDGGFGFEFPVDMVAVEEAAPAAEPAVRADAAEGGVPGVDFSTTNVQESGVDEPDIVKTDGKTLFAVAQGQLRAVDVSGSEPVLLGSLMLGEGWNHQLLLSGDRLLVISNGAGPIEPLPAEPLPSEEMAIVPQSTSTELMEIDVSDPAAMRIVRTLSLDGAYVSSRLTESTARIVITTTPALPFTFPTGSEPIAEGIALTQNRAVVAGARAADWLPGYVVEERATGWTSSGMLTSCDQVSHPAEFSGLGTLTVVTIDLDRGLDPIDSDSIMGAGQNVYASTEGLYVATEQWVDPARPADVAMPVGEARTAIHKFDISDPSGTRYVGSGDVTGYILNQWSMSEYDGFLRVASTTTPAWFGDVAQESQSFVTVFEEQAGELIQVGQVGGLGRGERIFGVRFMDEIGYVVTFRQIDPLYTVDLSDPRRPTVVGELKIPGYSAYLHPLGNGLLLGVGQDADLDGRSLGTQVSVFDVSDLANPVRISRQTLGNGWSEAEFDHHAFLYWPANRLAVLPVESWSNDGSGQNFVGAVGMNIDGSGNLSRAGTVTHVDVSPEYGWTPPIRRSVVVGGALYTVSELGLKASDLDTLTDQGWIPFV